MFLLINNTYNDDSYYGDIKFSTCLFESNAAKNGRAIFVDNGAHLGIGDEWDVDSGVQFASNSAQTRVRHVVGFASKLFTKLLDLRSIHSVRYRTIPSNVHDSPAVYILPSFKSLHLPSVASISIYLVYNFKCHTPVSLL